MSDRTNTNRDECLMPEVDGHEALVELRHQCAQQRAGYPLVRHVRARHQCLQQEKNIHT